MASHRMCFNMLCLIVLVVPLSAKRMKVNTHDSSQNISDATQSKSAGDTHPDGGKNDVAAGKEVFEGVLGGKDDRVRGKSDAADAKVNYDTLPGKVDRERLGKDVDVEGKNDLDSSILDDLAACPALPQDVGLVRKIFEMDAHWKTVEDQDAKQCSKRCGQKVGNIPKKITHEECCAQGHMVVSARLMSNAGAGTNNIPSLSIGNLCSEPDPKTGFRFSGVMRSLGANIAVYQQLKLMRNITTMATQLGNAQGALAHIAWVFANCEAPTEAGCWGDVVASKLQSAWSDFLESGGKSAVAAFPPEKDAFLSDLEGNDRLSAFANKWAGLDCRSDQVCSHGIQSDKDKVRDIMSGSLDLSLLP